MNSRDRLIYLHIGFNKAATTTLQEQVFLRHPQLSYLGRPYAGLGLTGANGADGDKIIKETIRAIRMKDTLSYDATQTQKDIACILDGLEKNGKRIVLSDEGLTNARYNDRRIIAQRLCDLFGSCQIIATIRNQLTCIPSLYFFLVRKNLTEDVGFENWLDEQVSQQAATDDAWTIRQFKYAEIFQLYREIFPEAEITFIPYEMLVEDKFAFASAIARCLGVDTQITLDTLLTSQPRNVVGSSEAAHTIRSVENLTELYLKLNKKWFPRFSLKKSMPAIWRAKEGLRNNLVRRVERRYRGRFALSERAESFLVDYFAADNARLCQLINCDLSKFGYPVLRREDLGNRR